MIPTKPRCLRILISSFALVLIGVCCGLILSCPGHRLSSIQCGDGVVDDGEYCDSKIKKGEGVCPTSCDDNDPCTKDSLKGNKAQCTARCSYQPITTCQSEDGCCPSGCNVSMDSDCTNSNVDTPDQGVCTHTNGIQDKSGICKSDNDCKCPYSCIKTRNITGQLNTAGSCWQPCTWDNPTLGCAANEKCFGEKDSIPGCVFIGSFSGSFSNVPIYSYPDNYQANDPLGNANVVMQVQFLGDLQFQIAYGQSYHINELAKDFVDIYLFNDSQPNINRFLVITFEMNQNYVAGGSFTMDPLDQNNGIAVQYQEAVFDGQNMKVSETIRAVGYSGPISLSAAGKGNNEYASGTIGNGSLAISYQEEICGSNTTPCKY